MPFPTVNPALAQALAARAYAEPTEVQAAVLDAEPGRDLLVSAQTGSGKTVAFGMAIAPDLLGDAERMPQPGPPLALAIAPTRELALQVKAELGWLYANTGARVVSCVGGMSIRTEQRALAAGCHIVVGTPGRLRDHLEQRALDFSALRAVVLDEADEMLDLGFREDLEFILAAAPETRRTLLFSATIPREIASLAQRFQRDALRIDTSRRHEPHADIDYRAVQVAPHDVERAVVNVLRYFEARAALVFCATREGVKRLHERLLHRGFDAVALSGELSQAERNAALQALRAGRASVCVATDVAARGLDLPELDVVIHADLPTNTETMLHRSGRTGRAGRKGTSVLMVPFARRRRAEQLLTSARVDAGWSDPPGAALITARDEERLLADPTLQPGETTPDALSAALLEKLGPDGVAAALARFLRARLPAPEADFHATPPPATRAQSGAPVGSQGRAPAGGESGAWFSIGVGRRNNADPKWLLPLICRLGGVTKAEIGAIRIFERDTRFEVAAPAAARFLAAARTAGQHEPRIEPAPSKAPAKNRPQTRAH